MSILRFNMSQQTCKAIHLSPIRRMVSRGGCDVMMDDDNHVTLPQGPNLSKGANKK